MNKINTRNEYGVKSAEHSYRNTGKGQFEQWTDFYTLPNGNTTEPATPAERDIALAQQRDQYPADTFIARKYYPEGYYRIYRKIK